MESPQSRNQVKVVGGNPAGKNAIPWQVGITDSALSSPFCGGTLIGPKTVLTAAHCVIDDPMTKNYRVIVGVTDVSNQEERLTR